MPELDVLQRHPDSGTMFDLRDWHPAGRLDSLAMQDDDQDAAIAWVGLVLMVFSAAAMIALTGLAVWWLAD